MLSNEIHFTFNPYWMSDLPHDERGELQRWLKVAGVNLNLCPGFDYDPTGKLITTRYYATDPEENPFIVDGKVQYEDQVREFSTTAHPPCVEQALKNWVGR